VILVNIVYNAFLMKKCNTNPVIKYIRIGLSLLVIGLGIFYKNWVGILGILTLISAFTGECAFNVKIDRSSHKPSASGKN